MQALSQLSYTPKTQVFSLATCRFQSTDILNFRASNYSLNIQAPRNRAITFSLSLSSSTASSEGVWAVPMTKTRTGMAS